MLIVLSRICVCLVRSARNLSSTSLDCY